MNIQVKQVENLTVPSRAEGHDSSGYDVVAISEPEIVGQPLDAVWKRIDYIQYKTGLFIAPQTDPYGHDYHTLIFPRSSVSKYNLILANCIGLVDVDYRGELLFRFKYVWQPEDMWMDATGHSLVGKVNMDRIYKKGDAIGQLVAEVKNTIDWVVVAELTKTVRGEGGFGSREGKIHPKPHEVPVDHTKSPLLEMYKSVHSDMFPTEPRPSYEKIMKEREKAI